MRMARPGRVTIQGSERMNSRAVGQHRAPFRGRRLGAEAKETECRRLENGARHAERRVHDERGEAIGQHRRTGKPAAVRRRRRAPRSHSPCSARRAPRRASGARSAGGYTIVTAMIVLARLGPRTATTRMARTRLGTAIIKIHQPRNRDVGERARHRRGKAQRDADDKRNAHHRNADEQGYPRAEDEARQHVMTVAVGSEDKTPGAARLPQRRRPHGVAKLLYRRIGGDDIRRQRRRTMTPNNGEAEKRRRGSRGTRPRTTPAARAARGRPSASSAIGGSSGAASAAMPDPRIDDAIDEVDDEVHADDDGRDQHHPALQRRIIAPADRIRSANGRRRARRR